LAFFFLDLPELLGQEAVLVMVVLAPGLVRLLERNGQG
jgi:hypothetical protein